MRRTLATLLIVAGLGLLGSVVLTPWVQAEQAARAQSRLVGDVPAGPPISGASVVGPAASAHPSKDRSAVPVAQRVDEGRAVAVMHIPRLGREWQWTAIEGTAPGLIEAGPGHYTGTALSLIHI